MSVHTVEKKARPERRQLNLTLEITVFSVPEPAWPHFFPSGSEGLPVVLLISLFLLFFLLSLSCANMYIFILIKLFYRRLS